MEDNQLILNLSDISFAYPESPEVLHELNLKFYRGDRLGLIGPNGCGKTTLFHIIMGLLKPTGGTLEIFGKKVGKEEDFREVRQHIGLLFQEPDDQLFSPTVLEDVAFGPLNLGKSQKEAKAIGLKKLEQLGLAGFGGRITHLLSGGEKRLVSLAAVLAMEPEVLLLDEPSNGLDDITKSKLMHVLLSLDLSYILISHEMDFLDATTDSICAMKRGQIQLECELHKHEHIHIHAGGDMPHEHGH